MATMENLNGVLNWAFGAKGGNPGPKPGANPGPATGFVVQYQTINPSVALSPAAHAILESREAGRRGRTFDGR